MNVATSYLSSEKDQTAIVVRHNNVDPTADGDWLKLRANFRANYYRTDLKMLEEEREGDPETKKKRKSKKEEFSEESKEEDEEDKENVHQATPQSKLKKN